MSGLAIIGRERHKQAIDREIKHVVRNCAAPHHPVRSIATVPAGQSGRRSNVQAHTLKRFDKVARQTSQSSGDPRCAVCGHAGHRGESCPGCPCPYYSPVKP